jgi:hypothetical protein
MAQPPFNIFTQHCDPDGALAKLRELLPDAKVELREDGSWSRIRGTWKRGWLKSALVLNVTHSPDYYAGPGWPTQVSGMMGYLQRFQGVEKRPDIFEYIPGLTFALSFIFEPDGSGNDDPRYAVVFEMAQFLEGIVFLPACLLDAEGRILIAADGETDENAQLPAYEPANSSDGISASKEEGDVEEVPAEPPMMERVAARFVLLTALVERGFMESMSDGNPEEMRQEMVETLKGTPAWEEAEADELSILQTPVGQLGESKATALPWLSEGAAVLAWALNRVDLPPYDQQADVYALYEARDNLEGEVWRMTLRSREELEKLSFQMLAIHWRIRQYMVKPQAMDFVEFAPRAWCGPMDLGLTRLVDNDLAIGAQVISQASERERIMAGGIMEERRTAIHWLLGGHTVYSQNDTST